ncbi:MAG: HD domain-containing protein [bacterium]
MTTFPQHKHLTSAQRTFLTRLSRRCSKGKLYLVGGTVRDLLLQKTVTDIDVVVTGIPLRTMRTIAKPLGSVHEIGARFGILRVTPKRGDFHVDIAIPRTEQGKRTGGYRDFSFSPDHRLPIEDDLSRRDCTVNAIAVAWPSGEVVDPFHGRRDLQRRILRMVGDPIERFCEDYSRLLRLVRFSVTLGFSIDPRTATAARKLMKHINDRRNNRFIVPREVIAEQLVRTFAVHPLRAFDACNRFDVFRILLPEVAALRGCKQPERFHSEGDAFAHTRRALANLSGTAFRRIFHESPTPSVIFSVLLHDIGKGETRRVVREHGRSAVHFWGHATKSAEKARTIAERLRLSSYNGLVETDDMVWLIRHHLIVTINDVRVFRASTLAHYFSGERGRKLLECVWADQSASLHSSKKPALEGFRATQRRLRSLFGTSDGLVKPPRPILTGSDLLREFPLEEGARVGEILRALREEQLSGRVRTKMQARTFVRMYLRTI